MSGATTGNSLEEKKKIYSIDENYCCKYKENLIKRSSKHSNKKKQCACSDKSVKSGIEMANLIQNNSKLISKAAEQQKNQISQTQSTIMQNNKREQTDDGIREPKTIRIIKDQSGFGFNVRGQISGELNAFPNKLMNVHIPKTSLALMVRDVSTVSL